MQLVPDKALNNNFFRGKYELTAVLGVAFYKTWKYKVISDISGLSVLCENYFSGVRTAAVETLSVIYKYFSLSIMLLLHFHTPELGISIFISISNLMARPSPPD